MWIFRHRLIPLHSEPTTAPAAATPSGPAVTAPEPSAPTADSSEVDFEALSKEFENDEIDHEELVTPDASPAPTPPATSASPTATVPAAASTPPAGPSSPAAAPVPAVAQPATPPPQTPQAQAPATPAPVPPVADDGVLTPEKVEAAYKQFEERLLPQLEESYKLTPEQVQQLEENAPVFIPKLMAQMHHRVQIAAYTGIMSQVPRIIDQVLKHHRSVEEALNRFHTRWPALKDEKHAAAVDQGLRAYRAANPNVSTADMIEKAGLMLMLSLGLDPTAGQQQPNQQPVTPQTPARPAGVAGSGPVTRPGVDPTNVFEAMAEEIARGEL